jgi:hypothetical protein
MILVPRISNSANSYSNNRRALIVSTLAISFLVIFLATSSSANAFLAGSPTPTSPTPCPMAWDVIPSPSNRDAASYLNAISASSPTDVWAVGAQNIGGATNILTQHWDGTTWTIVPGPQFDLSILFGVTALNSDNAWAVGTYDAFSSGPPLVQHWDGAAWKQVSIPDPAPGTGWDAALHSIAAVAANPDDVWTVGNYTAFPDQGSLIEHWDGVEWSLVFTDSLGSSLKGVDGAASDDVWAVGDIRQESGQTNTLTKHWDGTEWSTVSSPNPGIGNQLTGVTAISANDVWAVGYSEAGALTMHWNGSAWTMVPVPGDAQSGLLNGVTGTAADDVWAVGHYGIFPGIHTLVLHWDGAQWAQVYSPNVSSDMATLNGLATDPDGKAWAAGDYSFINGPAKTLIEQYFPGKCCDFGFTDVQESDYFYEAVRHLFCNGAISGYEDSTFRPYNNATRGQLTKIVVLAKGWPTDVTGGPHFSDVPEANPFYNYVETAYNHGIISGYTDGTFRWANDITRGQLSKVIVVSQQWPIDVTGGPHFSDVPESDLFYDYIETAYSYNIISGYVDDTFRPYNNAIRGQISKIVYLAVVQP